MPSSWVTNQEKRPVLTSVCVGRWCPLHSTLPRVRKSAMITTCLVGVQSAFGIVWRLISNAQTPTSARANPVIFLCQMASSPGVHDWDVLLRHALNNRKKNIQLTVIFLFCFVLFCFVLFCFVLFCFVLFCFVLFCFVLFCFVLFCLLFCFVLFVVLFCFVLFCFVLFVVSFCFVWFGLVVLVVLL